MKTLLAVFFIFSYYFFSCNLPIPGPVHSFKWTYNSVSYTAAFDTAMSSSLTPSGFPLIIAGLGPNTRYPGSSIFIQSHSLSVGTHIFDTVRNISLPQTLAFYDLAGNSFTADSGALVVSANANALISGSFSAWITASPGVVRTVSGQFVNVRIF